MCFIHFIILSAPGFNWGGPTPTSPGSAPDETYTLIVVFTFF